MTSIQAQITKKKAKSQDNLAHNQEKIKVIHSIETVWEMIEIMKLVDELLQITHNLEKRKNIMKIKVIFKK